MVYKPKHGLELWACSPLFSARWGPAARPRSRLCDGKHHLPSNPPTPHPLPVTNTISMAPERVFPVLTVLSVANLLGGSGWACWGGLRG